MKLTNEILDYLIPRHKLGKDAIRKLKTVLDYNFPLEQDPPFELDEEDLFEKSSLPRSFSPNRRFRKIKKHSLGSMLTVEELNLLIQEDWKSLKEQFPRFQFFWDSWKAGHLAQVLASGFTLNDVYTLLNIELRDYQNYSGKAAIAYRQLLQQQGTTVGRYSWVIRSAEIKLMIQFIPFRQQLLQEVRKLYQEDRQNFGRLSRPNGPKKFHYAQITTPPDTIAMRVWTILDLASQQVAAEIIEDLPNWKTELGFATVLDPDYIADLLKKLEERDWTSWTVITPTNIENTRLKSVVIPKGVTQIEDDAFRGCHTLMSVTLHKRVKMIGDHAFFHTGLTSISLPESVMDIGNYAFSECVFLKSVVIPEGVTVIGIETFSKCPALESAVIPESVTTIRYGAFGGCKSLKSVNIPNAVTLIEKEAFIACARPGEYLLSTNKEYLLDANPDKSDVELVIPDGVKGIGPCVFCNSGNVTSIKLPEGLRTIGNGAFCGCHVLTSLNIPESVTEIGDYAFGNCISLKVNIPNTVIRQGNDLFENCPGHYGK